MAAFTDYLVKLSNLASKKLGLRWQRFVSMNNFQKTASDAARTKTCCHYQFFSHPVLLPTVQFPSFISKTLRDEDLSGHVSWPHMQEAATPFSWYQRPSRQTDESLTSYRLVPDRSREVVKNWQWSWWVHWLIDVYGSQDNHRSGADMPHQE